MAVESISQELNQIIHSKNLYINDFFDEIMRDIDVEIETYLETETTIDTERINALRDSFINLIKSEKENCLTNSPSLIKEVRDLVEREKSEKSDDSARYSKPAFDKILHIMKRSLFCGNTLVYVKPVSSHRKLGYLIYLRDIYLDVKEVNLIRKILADKNHNAAPIIQLRFLVEELQALCQPNEEPFSVDENLIAIWSAFKTIERYSDEIDFVKSHLITAHADNTPQETSAKQFDDGHVVNLSSLRIQSLGPCSRKVSKSYSYISSLNLSRNRLTILNDSPALFEHLCSNLLELSLVSNSIYEIDKKSLSSLKQLKHLNLNENKLTSIPDQLFENLTELVRLELNSNKLERINTNALVGLEKLSYLDLKWNYLGEIEPNTFVSVKNLVTLDISSNRISNLANFDELRELLNLNLSSNKLEKLISKQFSGLERLQVLNLSNNQIFSVENDAFIGLNNLKVLTLDFNKIPALNLEAYENLIAIEILSLYENKITNLKAHHFDKIIRSYDRIKCFDIRRNNLSVQDWLQVKIWQMMNHFSPRPSNAIRI